MDTTFGGLSEQSNDPGTINSSIARVFFAAADIKQLAEFRIISKEKLLKPPSYACIPQLFAYHARSYLHDPAFWDFERENRVFRATEDLHEALSNCLAMPVAINCKDNYYYMVVDGLAKFVRGFHADAFRSFAIAGMPKDFYRIAKCDLAGGAAFAKLYPTHKSLEQSQGRFPRSIRIHESADMAMSAVFCIFFDRIYALAFLEIWLRSVAALGASGVGLHAHVMHRKQADYLFLDRMILLAAELGVPLSISVEEGVLHDRAYFASSRFLFGAGIMRSATCPVIFADADSYISDPNLFIVEVLPVIRGEKRILGLFADGPHNGYLPWRRFSATWLICPPSPQSARFLDLVGDCIEYFWSERDANWWIDQMALEVARDLLMTEMPGADVFAPVSDIAPKMMASSEAYKKASISAVPEIARHISAGKSYWQALHDAAKE